MEKWKGKIRSTSSLGALRNEGQETRLSEQRLQSLCFRSKISTEAVLYKRGKNESNSKEGMWSHYNITKIMCVVL